VTAPHEKLRLMRERMDVAYGRGRFVWPWTRWLCKHVDRRCIHGDEIIFGTRNGERSRCLWCGKTFPDLPVMCFFTDEIHPSMNRGTTDGE
jgi:hypothetical protein